jgi:hypothetical protein
METAVSGETGAHNNVESLQFERKRSHGLLRGHAERLHRPYSASAFSFDLDRLRWRNIISSLQVLHFQG